MLTDKGWRGLKAPTPGRLVVADARTEVRAHLFFGLRERAAVVAEHLVRKVGVALGRPLALSTLHVHAHAHGLVAHGKSEGHEHRVPPRDAECTPYQ